MDALYKLAAPTVLSIAALAIACLPARADTTLVLTITACSRDRCEETIIVPPAGTSMMACVTHGQMVAADWLRNNKPPTWQLKKYRCGPRETSI